MTARRERDDQKLEGKRLPAPVAKDMVPGPSDDTADEHVLQLVFGADLDHELVDFAAGAGGDPRLLAELALGLAEEGLVREENGRFHLIARRIPRRILESVTSRLADLSANCQHFLKVAAVLGKRFMLDDVSRMLDRSAATLLSTLDEAMVSGFVVVAERELAFESDFAWSVIVESIPTPARDALRREAMSLTRKRDQAYDRTLWVTQRPTEPYGAAKEGTGGSCSRAHTLIMNGDAATGVDVAEQILRDPSTSLSARIDAEACRILGYFLLGSGEAERLSEQILQDRGTAPGDIGALMALTTKSNLLWRAGKLATSLRLGRTAVYYSENVDPVWRLHFQLTLAGKLANLREFEDAESLINDTEGALRGLPRPVWAAAPAAMRSRLLLQCGRIGDASREAALATFAVEQDAVPMLRPLANSVLSTVSLYMEDLPAAIEYMNRVQRDVASHVVLDSAQYAWIEVLIAVKRQGPRAAAELLSEKYRHLPTLRSLYIEVPSAAAFLVLLARDVGDPKLGRAVLETVDGLARDNPDFPVIGLTAMHANALANSAPAALALIIVQSPDPISVALATEELAKLYASKAPGRRRRIASSETEEDSSRASACWAILSDMERRIAYLVGVGMTNRQIGKQIHLSAHTVNYHLRKVYKKLGINTRVELAHKAATYSSRAAIYSMEDNEEWASGYLDDQAV